MMMETTTATTTAATTNNNGNNSSRTSKKVSSSPCSSGATTDGSAATAGGGNSCNDNCNPFVQPQLLSNVVMNETTTTTFLCENNNNNNNNNHYHDDYKNHHSVSGTGTGTGTTLTQNKYINNNTNHNNSNNNSDDSSSYITSVINIVRKNFQQFYNDDTFSNLDCNWKRGYNYIHQSIIRTWNEKTTSNTNSNNNNLSTNSSSRSGGSSGGVGCTMKHNHKRKGSHKIFWLRTFCILCGSWYVYRQFCFLFVSQQQQLGNNSNLDEQYTTLIHHFKNEKYIRQLSPILFRRKMMSFMTTTTTTTTKPTATTELKTSKSINNVHVLLPNVHITDRISIGTALQKVQQFNHLLQDVKELKKMATSTKEEVQSIINDKNIGLPYLWKSLQLQTNEQEQHQSNQTIIIRNDIFPLSFDSNYYYQTIQILTKKLQTQYEHEPHTMSPFEVSLLQLFHHTTLLLSTSSISSSSSSSSSRQQQQQHHLKDNKKNQWSQEFPIDYNIDQNQQIIHDLLQYQYDMFSRYLGIVATPGQVHHSKQQSQSQHHETTQYKNTIQQHSDSSSSSSSSTMYNMNHDFNDFHSNNNTIISKGVLSFRMILNHYIIPKMNRNLILEINPGREPLTYPFVKNDQKYQPFFEDLPHNVLHPSTTQQQQQMQGSSNSQFIKNGGKKRNKNIHYIHLTDPIVVKNKRDYVESDDDSTGTKSSTSSSNNKKYLHGVPIDYRIPSMNMTHLFLPQDPTTITTTSPRPPPVIGNNTVGMIISTNIIEKNYYNYHSSSKYHSSFIQHLQSVQTILIHGGYYIIRVPDKRYNTDHHIPDTTIATIIDDHYHFDAATQSNPNPRRKSSFSKNTFPMKSKSLLYDWILSIPTTDSSSSSSSSSRGVDGTTTNAIEMWNGNVGPVPDTVLMNTGCQKKYEQQSHYNHDQQQQQQQQTFSVRQQLHAAEISMKSFFHPFRKQQKQQQQQQQSNNKKRINSSTTNRQVSERDAYLLRIRNALLEHEVMVATHKTNRKKKQQETTSGGGGTGGGRTSKNKNLLNGLLLEEEDPYSTLDQYHFTPHGLAFIIDTLYEMKYIDLYVHRLYETVQNESHFTIVLQRRALLSNP